MSFFKENSLTTLAINISVMAKKQTTRSINININGKEVVNSLNGINKAVREKNYHMIAYIYNGAKYKEMAKKRGREPYDVSLGKATEKWEKKLK